MIKKTLFIRNKKGELGFVSVIHDLTGQKERLIYNSKRMFVKGAGRSRQRKSWNIIGRTGTVTLLLFSLFSSTHTHAHTYTVCVFIFFQLLQQILHIR